MRALAPNCSLYFRLSRRKRLGDLTGRHAQSLGSQRDGRRARGELNHLDVRRRLGKKLFN